MRSRERRTSESLSWLVRAEQARRIAAMLTPKDAQLLESYAKECEAESRALTRRRHQANAHQPIAA